MVRSNANLAVKQRQGNELGLGFQGRLFGSDDGASELRHSGSVECRTSNVEGVTDDQATMAKSAWGYHHWSLGFVHWSFSFCQPLGLFLGLLDYTDVHEG